MKEDIQKRIRKNLNEAKKDSDNLEAMYAKAKEEGYKPTANKKVWKTIMLSTVKWNGEEFLPTSIKTPEDLKKYREYQAKESKETKKREGFKKLDLRKDTNDKMKNSKDITYEWNDSKAEWEPVPELVIRTQKGSGLSLLYYGYCQACEGKSEPVSFQYLTWPEQVERHPKLKAGIHHKPGCKLA